jgi:hypothetical protein
MRRCLTLTVILVCLPAMGQEPAKPPQSLSQEQQAKLKERDQFQKEAEKLKAEGKLTEAIAAAEKMLAIERTVYGNVHVEETRVRSVFGHAPVVGIQTAVRFSLKRDRVCPGPTLRLVCRDRAGPAARDFPARGQGVHCPRPPGSPRLGASNCASAPPPLGHVR